MNVSIEQVYNIVGKLTIENEVLKQENALLIEQLRKEVPDVPSEVPSAATGPDNK